MSSRTSLMAFLIPLILLGGYLASTDKVHQFFDSPAHVNIDTAKVCQAVNPAWLKHMPQTIQVHDVCARITEAYPTDSYELMTAGTIERTETLRKQCTTVVHFKEKVPAFFMKHEDTSWLSPNKDEVLLVFINKNTGTQLWDMSDANGRLVIEQSAKVFLPCGDSSPHNARHL